MRPQKSLHANGFIRRALMRSDGISVRSTSLSIPDLMLARFVGSNRGYKDINLRIFEAKIIAVDGVILVGDTPADSYVVKVTL